MKKIFLFIALIFCGLNLKSQVYLKGTALKKFESYKLGDTVRIYGMKGEESKNNVKYLVKYILENNVVMDYFPADHVRLVDSLNLWQKAWLRDRAADINKNGWDSDNRKIIAENAENYINDLKNNNLIFEDDLLYDYLYQLVNKIHPSPLYKEFPSAFAIIVVKSINADAFTFDNGLIVLTTGLIANTKSEYDMIHILSECIGHIIFEHNLANIKQRQKAERIARFVDVVATASSYAMAHSNKKSNTHFTWYDARMVGFLATGISIAVLDAIGAKYNDEQKSKVWQYANDFYNSNKFLFKLNESEYLKIISNTIGYTGWLNFYKYDYKQADILINRLLSKNIATEDDYYLKIKLKRMLGYNEKIDKEIIELIEKAKRIGVSNYIEFDKEEGLIYLRLQQKDKALAAFKRYKNGLLELERNGYDNGNEIKFVNNILYKYSLM